MFMEGNCRDTVVICPTLDDKAKKKLFKLMPDKHAVVKMCRKIAFSHFINESYSKSSCVCCGHISNLTKQLSFHISQNHTTDIEKYAALIEVTFLETQANQESNRDTEDPDAELRTFKCICCKKYVVLLFYHYKELNDPTWVVKQQENLCQNLKLNGKIRVAQEGINGTLEGCECAVEEYVTFMLERYPTMIRDDFKMSSGNGESFKEMKVTQYQELCSIGISPQILKPSDGGRHLSPDEFHEELNEIQKGKRDDTLLVDCRNFYESKIGYFEKAIRPDLRKFSYFPAYVEKNAEVFQDKRILMYCTGGIRCERASAYLKKNKLCKDVLQLKGGIHKYLEKYPAGHYKGKLFVFDERYSIGGESKPPVSSCKYCECGYDKYQLCTTPRCRQLVLSCTTCREKGKTACCEECQARATAMHGYTQECECTRSRTQIPIEDISIS